MPLPPTVLVVTAPGDLSADLVVRQLEDHGTDVHRVNPSDLTHPGVLRITGYADDEALRFHLTDDHRNTASASIVSVFWWHPETPDGWEQTESRAVLESLLFGLDDALWVNHPHKAAAARPGPGQLRLATTLGFRTPHTIYTNDPGEAAAFAVEQGGRVVCKTLTGHAERFIPARIVSAKDIESEAESVRKAVHYFQQPVEKAHDVRLTVVGERLFPCKITRNGDAIDWRAMSEDDLTFEPTPVANPLSAKVLRLMQELGLEYAALDFAVDTAGTWWFLEANPSGQFGFIEAATGMVISRAIADHLVQAAMVSRVFTPDGGHRASSRPGRKRTA